MPITELVKRYRTSFRELSAIGAPFKPLAAYRNWALANYEQVTGRSRIRARPLKITVDPTNICQLRCPLCPTGYRVQDRAGGHMDLHFFEHLMEEIGDYLFLIDFYNWGEPFLHPRLPELVGMAYRRGIATSFSTNLSLRLPDRRIRSIIESGLSNMICSIDGTTQDTYSRYRREGDINLVLENMRRIIEMRNSMGLRRPTVTWQFLVFRFNEHQRDEARKMAAEIGVDRLTFLSPYIDKRFALSDEDDVEVGQWAARDPAFNRYDPSHPEYVGKETKPARRCGWHYLTSTVNCDGTIAPCCTLYEKQDDFGKLDYRQNGSYMEVLNNEKFRSVRDRFAGRLSEPLDLVCEKCPTPSMMRNAPNINRRIAMMLMTQIIQAVKRVFTPGARPAPVPVPNASHSAHEDEQSLH